MASWVERSSKRKEINEYFSSINCMSFRIMEDIDSLRRKSGLRWKEMSVAEQEKSINEFMVPTEVKKHYPLPNTDDYSNIFPSFRIETGQKLIQYQASSDQSERPISWLDEFSDPFSVETQSQMELRLPPADESAENERELANNGKKSDKSLQENKKASSSDKKSKKKSSKSKKVKSDESQSEDQNCNHNNSQPSSISLSAYIAETGIKSEQLPSSKLSKTYKESEFLDLYPTQNYKQASPSYNLPDKESEILDLYPPLKSKQGSASYDLSNKESEFLDIYPTEKSKQASPSYDLSSKESEFQDFYPTEKSKQASPSYDFPDPGILRQKKKHTKKPSGGNNQVNPRSSLTLDGAIMNLEIAAELNRGGVSKTKNGSVFNNEEDLLRQIEDETELGDWLPDSNDAQKTGFDFLDNW